MQPNTVIETVDQATAIKWLEKNYAHQRTIRNRDVAKYATMMREGRWKLTHQGIAFSDTGKLLDGQHRLWAVIEAGVPVKMMVTRGLSEDSFGALDQNRVRSVADLAADLDVTATVVAVAKSAARGPSQGTVSPFFDDRDPELLLRFMHEHKPRLLSVVELKGAKLHNRGAALLRAPVLGFLFRASFHEPMAVLQRFADALKGGHVENPDTEAAVILLRDMVLAKREGGKDRQAELYQKTQRAFIAWRKGEPLKTLYVASDDLFPMPDRVDPRVVYRIGKGKVSRRNPEQLKGHAAKVLNNAAKPLVRRRAANG